MQINPHKPLLLGHRGAPRVAIENTIEAFQAALDTGIDGIELDVQRTEDGTLIVHHNFDINGVGISDCRWAELKKDQPHIPSLEEVFELTERYKGIYLNIEMKSRFPKSDGREVDLAHLLQSWSGAAKEYTWISSLDPLSLLRLQQYGVEVPLALLGYVEEVFELIPALPAMGVHVEHKLLTRERIQAWHDRGLFVVAWTVNDPVVIQQLTAWGIDGLIGDVPAYLLETRNE